MRKIKEMRDRFQGWLLKVTSIRLIYIVAILLIGILFVMSLSSRKFYPYLIIIVIVLFLFIFRPSSSLYKIKLEEKSAIKDIFTVGIIISTIIVCIIPMSKLPLWNGENPDHRNQYELMAENILQGRLSFDYGDEEQLMQLNNPYDPNERSETGVTFHWDHAFYNGKYYMYFGVVPVFLLFLPYRIITGTALTTYHATQIFVMAIIVGIFALFKLLAKLFFKNLPYTIFVFLAVAFSVMSVWYSIAEPALYCTAITAAIALQVWSLYFFIRAVWLEQLHNRQLILAGIGAFLGALVFGCRPTIALANILVVPMLFVYLRQKKITFKLLKQLILTASPYLIIAIALMIYNYVRFKNPFEFGQAYQLTVADQSQYGFTISFSSVLNVINNTWDNLFGRSNIVPFFPFLYFSGVFINFPILFLSFSALDTKVREAIKQAKLSGLMIGFVITILVVTVMEIVMTPYLLERYRMDLYFLVGIMCFISIGFLFSISTPKQRNLLSLMVTILATITIISSCLLYLRQVWVYYPDQINELGQILLSWRY